MGGTKRRAVPARLAQAQKRFANWRRTRRTGRRIPNSLWASAVKLAGQYGINRTARALGLDYYSLKKRLDERPSELPSASEPTFVELASPSLTAPGECIVEFEDAAGARMRIHLKGSDTPDLIALGRSFWSIER